MASGTSRKPRFARPAVTTDVVLCTVLDDRLHTLLIRRGHAPFAGAWAIPGGFLEVGDGGCGQGEDLIEGALRELEEETGLAPGRTELLQVGAFGRPDRDPRGRTVTVAYLGLVPPALVARTSAGDDASAAAWRPVTSPRRMHLAFDHAVVLDAALERLRSALASSALAAPLLPRHFGRAELDRLYTALDPAYRDRPTLDEVVRRLTWDGWLEPSGGSAPAAPRLTFRRRRRARRDRTT